MSVAGGRVGLTEGAQSLFEERLSQAPETRREFFRVGGYHESGQPSDFAQSFQSTGGNVDFEMRAEFGNEKGAHLNIGLLEVLGPVIGVGDPMTS
jgi:hypothetical protein